MRGVLVAGGQRSRDAVAHVLVQDLEGERLERGVDRRDLRQHVDAVAVLVDHPLDAPHLALDAVEALLQRVLVVAVLHQRASLGLWNRRSLSEFETTKRLEAAIAAAATIGLRRPAIASGIAATL